MVTLFFNFGVPIIYLERLKLLLLHFYTGRLYEVLALGCAFGGGVDIAPI